MSLRPVTLVAGTPYPEVTGLICRVPSQTLCPTRLGLLSQGHLCQFLVRTRALALIGFSRAPGIHKSPPKGAHSRFASLLTMTVLHDVIRLDTATAVLRVATCVTRSGRDAHGAGILTCFPFAQAPLRLGLGPTNPRLTIIAEETWPFRRCGFSPHYAVTHTRILIQTRSSGPQSPPSTHACPRSTPLPKEGHGIGGWLSPVHFPGP